MMTSPTSAGDTPARRTASRIAIAPRSTAVRSLNTPPKLPMGVRQALRITGDWSSVITGISKLVSPPACRFEHFGEALARRQIASDCLEDGDQRVERGSDFIGIGGRDVAPDVCGARCEPRRICKAAACKR